MVRDCEAVQEFWNNCTDLSCWSKFFSVGSYQWLDWNPSTKKMNPTLWDWPLFFGVVVWALWKDRNSLVFPSSTQLHNYLWFEVNSQVHSIVKEF